MHHVPLQWGDSGSFVTSLWKGLSVVEFSVQIFWGLLGLAKIGCGYSFWVVELALESICLVSGI